MSVLLDALKKAAAEKKANQENKPQVEKNVELKSDSKLADIEYLTPNNPQVSAEKLKNLNTENKSPSKTPAESQKLAKPASLARVQPDSSITEPKFKLAEPDTEMTPSKLMDVLSETQEANQTPTTPKNRPVESEEASSQGAEEYKLANKKAGLETLLKPSNTWSSPQKVSQTKPVKTSFSPALTTTLKPIKPSLSRKLYLFFLGLSAFSAILIYFALFIIQDLEQHYDLQVEQFSSNIQKPTQSEEQNDGDQSTESMASDDVIQRVETTSNQKQTKPSETQLNAEKNSEPQAIPNSSNTKARSESLEVTRPGAVIKVKREARVNENELAYQAYLESDLDRAEYHYRRGLANNPDSKNSQIGLAAVAAQRQDYEQAMAYYQQVLKQNSEDQDALQGIASIATELENQQAMMTELVNLARRYPDLASLQFALGNQYAQRQDWFKAQQHYFDSVSLEQNNPDYRLNLAVSLDHLGQFQNALEQYKLSLALAEKYPTAQFNSSAVYQRINLLQTFMEQN